MDMADSNDARLNEALACMDLGAIPDSDRRAVGATWPTSSTAFCGPCKSTSPQFQIPGTPLLTLWPTARDSRWIWSERKTVAGNSATTTISRLPEQFDKLTGKERGDRERSGQFESARDTIVTFIDAAHRKDLTEAAKCLDLSEYLPGAQAEIGGVLAYKLKFILDRTGRVYPQEVPSAGRAAVHGLSRRPGANCLGQKIGRRTGRRLALHRRHGGSHRDDVPDRGRQAARPGGLAHIAAVHRPVDFWEVPGLWLRHRLPPAAQMQLGPLDVYQWAGLVLAIFLTGGVAHVVLGVVQD